MKGSVLVIVALLLLAVPVACAAASETKAEAATPTAAAAVPKELLDAATSEDGFKPLLKEDLSDALIKRRGWAFEDGVLTAKGKGDLWTKERYDDFILDLEFKCDPETNSGVFIRCANMIDWINTAVEVQVLQPNDKYPNDKWHCAGIFDCLAPSKQMVKKAGEWNHFTIIAKGNMLFVIFNGEQVINMDLDRWTEPGKNPDGTDNKFKYAYKDLKRDGYIGLQYHGHPVWYRNLKIKPLK